MLLSVDMSSTFCVTSCPVKVRPLGMLTSLKWNKNMKLVRQYVSVGRSTRNGEKGTGTHWNSPFYNISGGQSHEMRTANTRKVVGKADSW